METLNACSAYNLPFQEMFSILKPLVFRSDVAITVIAPNEPLYQQQIENHLNQGDCFTQKSIQNSAFKIEYMERQPYCVADIALFCHSYTVAPWKKIRFDFQQGKNASPIGLASAIIIGLILGFQGSRQRIASGKQSIFYMESIIELFSYILYLVLGAVLLVAITLVMVFVAAPVLNWIFFPSTFEFIVRSLLLATLTSYTIHQLGYSLTRM
jgi:hypothetical protein